MTYDPHKHHRRSIRLPAYDYTQAGAYFVTLVVRGHECLLGDVLDGEMRPNSLGQAVEEEWTRSSSLRSEIDLDGWVVMPNHLHGIVIMQRHGSVGAHGRAPLPDRHQDPYRSPRSLGSFLAGFKAASTKRVNVIRGTPGHRFWQRNYHERIIRDDAELDRIRRYVTENPLRWPHDPENPMRQPAERQVIPT